MPVKSSRDSKLMSQPSLEPTIDSTALSVSPTSYSLQPPLFILGPTPYHLCPLPNSTVLCGTAIKAAADHIQFEKKPHRARARPLDLPSEDNTASSGGTGGGGLGFEFAPWLLKTAPGPVGEYGNTSEDRVDDRKQTFTF
jgi:hypothetical protein